MKYYVYQSKRTQKNEKTYELYFVAQNALTRWGAIYKPELVEYTGVCVKASSKDEARNIYLDPTALLGEKDVVFSEDEPAVTKVISAKKRIGEVSMDLLVQRLAHLWMQIDDMLRAMAEVYCLHNKDMSKEEAYKNLKTKWLKKYLDRP